MKRASSELLLLDVNVLLALAWPSHQFHATATERLVSSGDRWATCVLTQLGFIRLSSNPAIVTSAKTPAEAATLLAAMVRDSQHVYLASLHPPSDEESIQILGRILGSKKVTDAYLLRVARQHGAKLVTFDMKLNGLAKNPKEIEVLTGSA